MSICDIFEKFLEETADKEKQKPLYMFGKELIKKHRETADALSYVCSKFSEVDMQLEEFKRKYRGAEGLAGEAEAQSPTWPSGRAQ